MGDGVVLLERALHNRVENVVTARRTGGLHGVLAVGHDDLPVVGRERTFDRDVALAMEQARIDDGPAGLALLVVQHVGDRADLLEVVVEGLAPGVDR